MGIRENYFSIDENAFSAALNLSGFHIRILSIFLFYFTFRSKKDRGNEENEEDEEPERNESESDKPGKEGGGDIDKPVTTDGDQITNGGSTTNSTTTGGNGGVTHLKQSGFIIIFAFIITSTHSF